MWGKRMKFKLEKKYVLRGLIAFLVVAGGILLYYLIFHGSNIRQNLNNIFLVTRPVVYGLIIAYIMTPTLNFIEKKIKFLFSKCKINIYKHQGKIRGISILFASVLFIFVIYALIAMLVSQIVPSIENIVNNFDTYINGLIKWVNKLFEDNSTIAVFVQNSINTYSHEFENWLSTIVIPQASDIIKTLSMSVISVMKVLWNFIIGFVISIYLMFNKDVLSGQAKKIVYAFWKTKTANMVIHEVRSVHQTFVGFISGKVIDSIIIGLLCFIGTTIIGTPYAALVSVIVGVTNVIPFFGPYLGAIPCTIFILIVDLAHPLNCVYFAIFIFLLQQFDGNILGPKILGDSTGLSGLWVIISITLFGGLFGIFGMIIGVPIFAVLYSAIKRIVNYNLDKRKLPTETSLYLNVGSIDGDAKFTEYNSPQNSSLNKVFSKRDEHEDEEITRFEDLKKHYYKLDMKSSKEPTERE